MFGFIIKIFLASLTFVCFSSFVSNENTEEYLEFYLDLNKWKLAFKNSNEWASVAEFILKDESLNNWSEMITVQKFPTLLGPLDQYYEGFMNNLKNSLGNDQVFSKLINSTDESLFFEWWVSEKNDFAQHELFRLVQTANVTWVLRYTTKKISQVEKTRNYWEGILKDAKICLE